MFVLSHIIVTTHSTQHCVRHEHRMLTEQISYIVCAWPIKSQTVFLHKPACLAYRLACADRLPGTNVRVANTGFMRQGLESHHMWYRRTFSVPQGWAGQQVLLHFGAVDWQTQVRVNNIQLGTHLERTYLGCGQSLLCNSST